VAFLGRDGVIGGDGIAHVAADFGWLTPPLRHGRIVQTAANGFFPTSVPGPARPDQDSAIPPGVGGLSLRPDPGRLRQPRLSLT
jgi:hypothetical protein